MAALAQNELDEKILLKADHMSPEEISRALGGVISPAKVAVRIKELIKSRNWLTDYEEEQVVLWKMKRIVGKLEEATHNHLDLDSAKVLINALKAIAERLDKRRAATQEELTSLHANQAQIMFEAIKVLIEKAAIDVAAQQELRKALPEAVYVISARNMGEAIEA
jgi:transcription initiation factor IIE alpha subunit